MLNLLKTDFSVIFFFISSFFPVLQASHDLGLGSSSSTNGVQRSYSTGSRLQRELSFMKVSLDETDLTRSLGITNPPSPRSLSPSPSRSSGTGLNFNAAAFSSQRRLQSNKVTRTQSLNWPKQVLASPKEISKRSSSIKLGAEKNTVKSEHNGASHRSKEVLSKERTRSKRRVKKILLDEEFDLKREFIVPQGKGPTHNGYKVAHLASFFVLAFSHSLS